MSSKLPIRWWAGLLLLVIVAAGALLRALLNVAYAGNLTLQGDTAVFVSIAENLSQGFPLVDPSQAEKFSANPYLYRSPAQVDPTRLVPYSGCHDLGLAFFYWLAIKIFQNSATPPLLLAWLQVIVDCLNIVLVFLLGRRLKGDTLGLTAALAYAGLWPVASLSATFPFYYTWTGFMALYNIAFLAWLLSPRFLELSPVSRFLSAIAYGLFLALATVVRSLFLPLTAVTSVYLLLRWRRYLPRMAPVVAVIVVTQLLTLSPVFHRNYTMYGRPVIRWVWHAAYTGIGAHPNPYGLTWDDSHGFKFAAQHGLSQTDPMFVSKYDELLHKEVVRIYSEQPWMFVRNACVNVLRGFTGLETCPTVEMTLGGYAVTCAWQPPPWLEKTIPDPWEVLGFLLVFQFLYFLTFLRERGDVWLYCYVVLQAVFIIASISSLCPPFVFYNSCFYPVLALLLGVAAYSVIDVTSSLFGDALRDSPVALRWLVAAAIILVAMAQNVFTAKGGYACTWPQLVAVAGPVFAGAVLASAVALWLDHRAAGVAAVGFLVVIGGLKNDVAHLFGSDPYLYVIAGGLPILIFLRGTIGPSLCGVVLSAGTLFHPELALVPLAVMVCLTPERVLKVSMLERLRKALPVATTTGAIALVVSAAMPPALPYGITALTVVAPLIACVFSWGVDPAWLAARSGLVARVVVLSFLLLTIRNSPSVLLTSALILTWLPRALFERFKSKRSLTVPTSDITSPSLTT